MRSFVRKSLLEVAGEMSDAVGKTCVLFLELGDSFLTGGFISGRGDWVGLRLFLHYGSKGF